ncbi:hypothetical protein Tco_0120122, partial [Tanacetum coccineum]
MYCSMVSAIASASSSSEYSLSESRLKSCDLNSSRLRVLKCLIDDRNSHSGSLRSIRRIQWKWIHRIDQLNENALLDRELDTPYPIEVDTPYSAINQN